MAQDGRPHVLCVRACYPVPLSRIFPIRFDKRYGLLAEGVNINLVTYIL